MTIIQQLNQAKEQRYQAQQKVMEMETDILVIVKSVNEILHLTGLDKEIEKMKTSKGDPKLQIGKIAMSVLPKLVQGKFPKKRIAELWENVAPLTTKYKHLINPEVETENGQNLLPPPPQKQKQIQ